jgi:hypothetical protein
MKDRKSGQTCPVFLATVERAKREVLRDIRDGHVPVGVRSFSELHDHIDANYYGGAFDVFDGSDESVAFWNAVQGAVDAWLRAGGA